MAIDEHQFHALLAKAADAAFSDYDFMTAEQAIRKALTVSGNNTLVIDAYWWLVLSGQRRFDEALEYLGIAEEDDPLSPLVKQGIGYNLAWSGDYQASIPYLEAGLDLNPNDIFSAAMLSMALADTGRLDEAEAALRQSEGLPGPEAFPLWARAFLHIARDEEPEARQVLARMIALYDAGNDEPLLVASIAVVNVHLGNIEEAIDWFERATETPNPFHSLISMECHDIPALWDHPRAQSLVKRINLDDASVAAAKAAVAAQ